VAGFVFISIASSRLTAPRRFARAIRTSMMNWGGRQPLRDSSLPIGETANALGYRDVYFFHGNSKAGQV
jgi:hypothetical protein